MILVDTGPLVALFNPRDGDHAWSRSTLAAVVEPLVTTVPVLTEAFHLLNPKSRGARALIELIERGGMNVWWLSPPTIARAFQLMEQYADRPMDLADASLVAAAEGLRTTKVFTIDRREFLTYRARIGRQPRTFTLI